MVGAAEKSLREEDVAAIEKGMANLLRHVNNVRFPISESFACLHVYICVEMHANPTTDRHGSVPSLSSLPVFIFKSSQPCRRRKFGIPCVVAINQFPHDTEVKCSSSLPFPSFPSLSFPVCDFLVLIHLLVHFILLCYAAHLRCFGDPVCISVFRTN